MSSRQRKKRITQELKQILDDPSHYDIQVTATQNIGEWVVNMGGPHKTPYHKGHFHVSVVFPADYPVKCPDIKFETKIYHINVSLQGKICIAALVDEWSPMTTMGSLLEDIFDLFSNPDPSAAINENAINLFAEDRKRYDEQARAETEKHAMVHRKQNQGGNDDDAKVDDSGKEVIAKAADAVVDDPKQAILDDTPMKTDLALEKDNAKPTDQDDVKKAMDSK